MRKWKIWRIGSAIFLLLFTVTFLPLYLHLHQAPKTPKTTITIIGPDKSSILNELNNVDGDETIPDSGETDESGESSIPGLSQTLQEKGFKTGLPLIDPPNLNTLTPPNLSLQLIAGNSNQIISGKKVFDETYNNSYIGPTMHFAPGEKVSLTLVNNLKTPTNLHFHGMHISPSGDSDNPFLSILPGKKFTYHLNIPADQPFGTFWYHDHDMCTGNEMMQMPGMSSTNTPGSVKTNGSLTSNCEDVESQIFSGLSGSIIVGDDRLLLPKAFHNIATHTLVLKDMQLDANNHILQNTSSNTINSDQPTVRLINGELRPILSMRPGETQLWRIANEGVDIFYNLELHGYTFVVVGQDGSPTSNIFTMEQVLLPPGKRYDLLVQAPLKPGATWLKTVEFKQGDDIYPTVKLMKVLVTGKVEQPLALPTKSVLQSPASLISAKIAKKRTLVLSENQAGTLMYINGKSFSMNQPTFSDPAVLGTVEEWSLINKTHEIHPFHIHTEHFQVISINGVAQRFVGMQDIIPVPAEKNGVPGSVVLRVPFTDFTGRVMFHCHIAAHEDSGMMGYINVIAPRKIK
jgi:FtsP/CotA-like multicopper oxidase with cupredoxin domain